MTHQEIVDSGFAQIEKLHKEYKETGNRNYIYYEMLVNSKELVKSLVLENLQSGKSIEDSFKDIFPTSPPNQDA